MATTNTCKKCGCEDSFMPSPATCPTPIGCPTPEPCSEVMDAQCVIYTGANILCDTDIVVTTNDTVAEAIESVIDYFCNNTPPVSCCPTFVADIQPSQTLEFGLRVDLTNGTAPFTYAWSYAQYSIGSSNDFRGIVFIGSLTNSNVQLTLDDNYYQGFGGTPSILKQIYSTHIKVRVTDSVGQIADAYYIATRVNNAPA
jgi:hypothetical protein